jgi:hypothetical protein
MRVGDIGSYPNIVSNSRLLVDDKEPSVFVAKHHIEIVIKFDVYFKRLKTYTESLIAVRTVVIKIIDEHFR